MLHLVPLVKHLWCCGMILLTLLCSRNLILSSEVHHLPQKALSSCTLIPAYYCLFVSCSLVLKNMLGPAAGALLFWGVLCLGPKATLKGFLFCFVSRRTAVYHSVYVLEKGKKTLPFLLRKLLSYLSLHDAFGSFSFCEYHLSCVFTLKALERELVVLLHMDFRLFEGKGGACPLKLEDWTQTLQI